jgi:hypothetical protein
MKAYNTSNGRSEVLHQLATARVVRQSADAAFYLMQTLQIGAAQVLTFYASGANGNLIDGSLAESLGLTVLDDTPATVTVVGGGSISTKYGTYCCILGPDSSNQYHELELQGIESITKPYPPIDLSSLVVEASSFLPNQAWPTQIGGCDVQLLIGIKNTLLVPRVKFVLPNGLAIYESALIDVFGSRLCFGGPHALFKEVYRSRGGNYNSLEAILTETASAYRQSPWTFICKEEPSSKDGVMALVLELQTPPPKQEAPTNVENQEGLALPDRESQAKGPDAPLVEAPSLEVMLTSVEHQETEPELPTASDKGDCDFPTCDHPLHQGHPIEVHKSIIPLTKLKGLIDEIDIPDVQDARCETCANCPACKLSAREKTKSLQEEFEQDVIKKSVETNTAHGVVFANLPFLRDPVEYLTKKHGGNNNRYQAARIYQAQCKKPEFVKEGVRKA